MSAAAIVSMRGASAFSTNRRGVSGLFYYPAAGAGAAAAPSPSSYFPFLYGNRRGQVLHIPQFVEAYGNRLHTVALVRRMEARGVPSKHIGTGSRSTVRMSAAGIACVRGASRSRLVLATFSTNCRGINSLIPYPAAAAVPSCSGPFLYGNQRGQVLHISQFVEANGMRVRRMVAQGVPLKHAEAIVSVISEVLNDKGGMQKDEMIRDANLSKLHSQEYLSSPLHMELEKVRGDIEEMRNAIKFDIEKASNDFKKSCIGIISVCLMSALLVLVPDLF